jgi:hypothetical protein
VCAFVLAIILIWQDWNDGTDEEALARAWGGATVVSFALTQAGLLLLHRQESDGPVVSRVLIATVVVTGVLATVLVVAIALAHEEVDDAFYRVLGVLAVLDVLGTVLVPILRRLGGGSPSRVETSKRGALDRDLAHQLGLAQDASAIGELYVFDSGLDARVDAALAAGAELIVARTELADGGAVAVVRRGTDHLALMQRSAG